MNAAPPHQGNADQFVIMQHPQTKQKVTLAWCTQFAYQAGRCQACLGSGSTRVRPLPKDRLGEDFVYGKFMADHWKDQYQAQKELEHLRKGVKAHHESTNAPSKDGLRLVLQGVGLNQNQAELVLNAISGYVDL